MIISTAYHNTPYDKGNKGKLMSMHIVSAPDSPWMPSDEGWVGSVSPRGSLSALVRVETTIRFPTPIVPTKPYRLGGGMMLLTNPDMELIIIELCKMILLKPHYTLGSQNESKAVSVFGLEASLRKVAELKVRLEAQRREEISIQRTSSLFRPKSRPYPSIEWIGR
jgi:hypothetical protein